MRNCARGSQFTDLAARDGRQQCFQRDAVFDEIIETELNHHALHEAQRHDERQAVFADQRVQSARRVETERTIKGESTALL